MWIIRVSFDLMTRAWQRDVIRPFGSSYCYKDKFIIYPCLFKSFIYRTIFLKSIVWCLLIEQSYFKRTLLKRAKIQTAFNVYYVIRFREWYGIGNPQCGIRNIGSHSVNLTVSRKESWWAYNIPCYLAKCSADICTR